MVTKIDMIVTYLDRSPPIKLLNPLIMWSCEIPWQTKNIYLNYYSLYGHQTWQGNDLPPEAPIM